MQAIRLFIIEEQSITLKHLSNLIRLFEDILIIGTASCSEDALRDITLLDIPPDVVLCDLQLPSKNGINITKSIKAIDHRIEIVIFTLFDDEEKVLSAIHDGASGYLLKDAAIHKIHEAIVQVFNGGTVMEPVVARRMLKYFAKPIEQSPNELLEQIYNKKPTIHKPCLSLRELECLQIIAKGLSNQEAASVLKLSKATIRTHLEHIYQKLDVTNRVEAITEGIRQGIIDL